MVDEELLPIVLTSVVETTRAQGDDPDMSDTKIADNSLVDVFINGNVTGGGYPTVYSVGGGVLTPQDESQTQAWNNKTSKVNIFAVNPAGANANGYIDVREDQGTITGYSASDLLFCNYISNISYGPVQLTFRHALSKIIINLISDDSGGNPNITQASVELLNIQRRANFTPGTAAAPISASTVVSIPETATSTINLGTQSSDSRTIYSFAGIVPPQTIYKQLMHATVTLKDAGQTEGQTFDGLYWQPEESISLQPGRCYTFNLSIIRNQILLREAVITPWDEGEGTSHELLNEERNITE